ncbi:hypothetical protein D3C83_250630 [compost metagenome]
MPPAAARLTRGSGLCARTAGPYQKSNTNNPPVRRWAAAVANIAAMSSFVVW